MKTHISNRIVIRLAIGLFAIVLLIAPVAFDHSLHFSDSIAFAQDTEAKENSFAGKIGDAIFNALGYSLLQFFSLFTYVGGKLLQTSLDYTVFEMGKHVNTTTLGGSINAMWTLIRDICNLAFIFGFIYVGIRTIIDPDSASTKRFLSRIIIGALLINFSLFFTKAIVDVSNFTSYQIYTSMTTGSGDLSSAITDKLRIITFYNPDNGNLKDITAKNSFSFFLMGSLFLVVAAFTFLAAALLLVIRFVALILIMVASPLLFAATVFPQTEHYASDLWKKLFSYSFFAPVYLLLVLISIKLIDGLALKGSIGKDIGGISGNLTAVLNFTIIIFFMIAALVIASRIGVIGGDMAISVGNNLRGKAQSFIGRNSVGRLSHGIRERYEKIDAQMSKTKTGRFARGTLTALSLGALGDKGIRSTLQAGEQAKFGGIDSYESLDKYKKEHKARQANLNKMSKFQAAFSGDTLGPSGELIRGQFDLKKLSDPDRIKVERAVADATVKDLEELEQDQREAIAGIMTQSQIEGLMKSEKLTDDDKKKLGEKRQGVIAEIYTRNKDLLSKASADQLETLGYDYLNTEENSIRLTSSQMDDLKKKLTPTEFKKLNQTREEALMKLAEGGEITTKEKGSDVEVKLTHEYITRQKPGEIAKMPASVLKQMAEVVPVAALAKIVQDGTINKEDQAAMRKSIEDASRQNLPPEDRAHINDVEEFFKDSPLGKQFGK